MKKDDKYALHSRSAIYVYTYYVLLMCGVQNTKNKKNSSFKTSVSQK